MKKWLKKMLNIEREYVYALHKAPPYHQVLSLYFKKYM